MQSIIPKREIGAIEYLEKYPEHDGRGTIIAVWDTGVDPTANGLQLTSDGKPKVIDFIDASGSGDVKMLDVFKITSTARTITTLTGRKITIPKFWKPKDGLIRVGAKPASELFPKNLMERVKEQFKAHQWTPTMQHLSTLLKEVASNPFNHPREASLARLEEKLQFEGKQPEVIDVGDDMKDEDGMLHGEDDDVDNCCFLSCTTPTVSDEMSRLESETASPIPLLAKDPTNASPAPLPCMLSPASNLADWLSSLDPASQLESIQTLEKVLSTLNENSDFFCPVFDCFLFEGEEDGDFVCCVDTSPYEDGEVKLTDLPLMKDFAIGRQVTSFGNKTLLYYTVKILDQGRLLQIVTNSGSHGTHVAGIAAAYYPDNGPLSCPSPELSANQNGIAPGAQIVSVKIADTHLQGMETNVALLRAINWTRDLGCDIVNYSFGESSYLPGFGRIYTHLSQFVMETNTCFVTSGGNDGPSLGTVGSPGGSVAGLISVAPLVFPNMMEYMYCQPTCNQRSKTKLQSVENSKPAAQLPVAASAYTWGSRGPSPDGSLDLMVSAAGGAVADVAAWEYQANGLKNGSSMSSPAVAGAISLVLSGLRTKLDQTCLRPPFPLWRSAILRSARPIEHLSTLDQGAGVFHVESTFSYLHSCLTFTCGSLKDAFQSITLEEGGGGGEKTLERTNLLATGGWYLSTKVLGPGCVLDNKRGVHSRGIWLRKGWLPLVRSNDSPKTVPQMAYTICLIPTFSQDISVAFKRNFSLNLAVTVECENGALEKNLDFNKPTHRPPWLQLAPYAMVTNCLREIPLIIEPNAFDAGEESLVEGDAPHPPSRVSHTRISFVNLDSPQHEVLAQLPITIQIPQASFFDYANGVHRFNLIGDFHYKQKVCRWFIRIPHGSTAGVLRLRRLDVDGGSCAFTITTVVPTPFGSVPGTGLEQTWNRIPLLSSSAGGVGGNTKMATFDAVTGDYRFAFPVAWIGDTLEVTVAQHWGAQTPNCSLKGSVIFRGLQIEPPRLILHTSQNHLQVDLRSHFGLESIQWEFKTKHWVLPLKPSSSGYYFLSLGCLDNKRHPIKGTHVLRLEYKFFCPFKSATVLASMRRLTALLYDANCLEVVYHISDVHGRYLGAGSFHKDESAKYTFSLSKGCYTVVVQIMHLESKKILYASPGDGGENEVLEKLQAFPLLVYFRLTGSETQGSALSGAYNLGAQLGLEVSTSLATLGLYGADFTKSYNALHYVAPSGTEERDEAEDWVEEEVVVSPVKGSFLANPRLFPTVPHLLAAGDVLSTVVGIVHENFAPYAIPGSYFEGHLKYYGNKELSEVVKSPFEIIVGANQNATYHQPTTAHVKVADRAGTLQPGDFRCLFPLVETVFAPVGGCSWTPPLVRAWRSSPESSTGQKLKKPSKVSNFSEDSSNNSIAVSSWTQLVDSLASVAVSDTGAGWNRHQIWSDINLAMTRLVEFASSSSSSSSSVASSFPIVYLTPVTYPGANPLCIPLLTSHMDEASCNTDPTENMKSTVNESGQTEPKNKSLTISRSSVIECLAIYGRYLAERLLVDKEENVASLDFSLRLLLARLSSLVATTSNPHPPAFIARDPPVLLKLAFVGPNGGFRADLSTNEVEKLRPVYFACFLAHLLVYHSGMPVLSLLTRIAFQLDEPSSKTLTTLGLKQTRAGLEKAAFDCSSIAFPWMILQLRKMGLGCLAIFFERQLPMRFPSFDYSCFQRKLNNPTLSPTSSSDSK